jgi:ATP-dependent 26S proteasome regulatory subunit
LSLLTGYIAAATILLLLYAAAAAAPRALHYADLGGVEDVLADIQELIEYPLKHPEVSPRLTCSTCMYVCLLKSFTGASGTGVFCFAALATVQSAACSFCLGWV